MLSTSTVAVAELPMSRLLAYFYRACAFNCPYGFTLR